MHRFSAALFNPDISKPTQRPILSGGPSQPHREGPSTKDIRTPQTSRRFPFLSFRAALPGSYVEIDIP
jgi:hypothetical protein